MNEKRNRKSLVIALLMIVIVGLSIGYAALSQQLIISGVGTVKGSTWNIIFDNLKDPEINGYATIDADAQLINNSTTMNFAVSLKQPGDSVFYRFDVKNQGTINAEVSAITLTGVTEAEEANITYTLTYEDGSQIKPGDQLLAQESRGLILSVIYNSSASTVSEEDIELDLGATITYIQR